MSIMQTCTRLGVILSASMVVLWAWRFRWLPQPLRWLGWYAVLNLPIQLLADWLWQQSLNNLPLLHLNILVEFVVFSLFFRDVYRGHEWFKRWLGWWLGAGIAGLLGYSLFIRSLDQFPAESQLFVKAYIIAGVVLYLFDAFGRVDFAQPRTQAIGVSCFALLTYYSGSLFIFLFNQLAYDPALKFAYQWLWAINGVLVLGFDLVILWAMYRGSMRRDAAPTTHDQARQPVSSASRPTSRQLI